MLDETDHQILATLEQAADGTLPLPLLRLAVGLSMRSIRARLERCASADLVERQIDEHPRAYRITPLGRVALTASATAAAPRR